MSLHGSQQMPVSMPLHMQAHSVTSRIFGQLQRTQVLVQAARCKEHLSTIMERFGVGCQACLHLSSFSGTDLQLLLQLTALRL